MVTKARKINTARSLSVVCGAFVAFVVSYVLLGSISIVHCSCDPNSFVGGVNYSVPILWPLNKFILALFVSLFVVALMVPAKNKYSKIIRVLILAIVCMFVCYLGSLLHSSCDAVLMC